MSSLPGPAKVIEVTDLGMRYRIYRAPIDRLKQIIVRTKRTYYREHWALRDISFDVERGTTFGIIGPNGCGKSTLLKIVAGLLTPTTGRVSRVGRVAALLELGAGFNPEYSGKDNVFLNGAILGLTRGEIRRLYPEIVEFSQLEEYMDQPVKTYSSGMFVRLAFSIAAHLEPEVLIIDEALAVGDAVFQHRCIRKLHELQHRGATILFVTHDMNSVSSMCNRALWLDRGRVRLIGAPDQVVKHYLAWAYSQQDRELKMESTVSTGPAALRYGNGKATLLDSQLFDAEGEATRIAHAGKVYSVRLQAECRDDVAAPILGFQIRDHYGREIFSINTLQARDRQPPVRAGQTITADFRFLWPEIAEEVYSLSPAAADGTQEAHQVLDWIDSAILIQAVPRSRVLGVFRVPDVDIQVRTEAAPAHAR